jgi:hypothetical protein
MIEKHSNAKMQVWQRGFKYTLTNGYTLSCAFGWGNYCGNRDCMGEQIDPSQNKWEVSCEDFEVAVFEPNGDIVDLFPAEVEGGWSDQVVGFVPASALPMLISALKFWPVRRFVTAARCSATSARTSWTRLIRRLQMSKRNMDDALELLGSCLLILIVITCLLFA